MEQPLEVVLVVQQPAQREGLRSALATCEAVEVVAQADDAIMGGASSGSASAQLGGVGLSVSARWLKIKPKTVEDHLTAIFKRLQVSGRSGAVALYVRWQMQHQLTSAGDQG